MSNGQPRSKRRLPVTDVEDLSVEALSNVLGAAQAKFPDPHSPTYAQELDAFVNAVARVFPWRRGRGTGARWPRWQSPGHAPMPSPEAALHEYTRLATNQSTSLEIRERAEEQLRETQRTLVGILTRVVDMRHEGGGTVFTTQHPVRFSTFKTGKTFQIVFDGDWPDLLGHYTFVLCHDVGFERLESCRECGRLFVTTRIGRKIWCDERCGTRTRVRQMKRKRAERKRLENQRAQAGRARLEAGLPTEPTEGKDASASSSYPAWRYHAAKLPVIVYTPAEDALLGEGWTDTPAAFAPPNAGTKKGNTKDQADGAAVDAARQAPPNKAKQQKAHGRENRPGTNRKGS